MEIIEGYIRGKKKSHLRLSLKDPWVILETDEKPSSKNQYVFAGDKKPLQAVTLVKGG